jgi:hypothetical protein
MYKMIVKKKMTSVFERLNNGDYEYALSDTLVLEALDQPGIDQQTVEASGLGSRCAGIE